MPQVKVQTWPHSLVYLQSHPYCLPICICLVCPDEAPPGVIPQTLYDTAYCCKESVRLNWLHPLGSVSPYCLKYSAGRLRSEKQYILFFTGPVIRILFTPVSPLFGLAMALCLPQTRLDSSLLFNTLIDIILMTRHWETQYMSVK